MDNRERRSLARGVYPTQYASRMGTVRMKQEEGTDTRIMQESSKKYVRNERGHEGEKSQLRPTSYKDLTIMLTEGRDSVKE